MVTTCSHPQPDVQIGTAGTSNDQNALFEDLMRCMTDSMEALKKQNKDIASRLSAKEGRDGRRDREHEERREERCKEKRAANHEVHARI